MTGKQKIYHVEKKKKEVFMDKDKPKAMKVMKKMRAMKAMKAMRAMRAQRAVPSPKRKAPKKSHTLAGRRKMKTRATRLFDGSDSEPE